MAFLFTYLHFMSFITLVSLLAGEYALLRRAIDTQSLLLLKRLDIFYGIAAICVIATGITRIFYEKGWDYYSHNHLFWTKIVSFLIVGILSIYPTVFLIKAKQEADIQTARYLKIKKLVLIQLLFVPIVVFCAIGMARGIH